MLQPPFYSLIAGRDTSNVFGMLVVALQEEEC